MANVPDDVKEQVQERVDRFDRGRSRMQTFSTCLAFAEATCTWTGKSGAS